MPPQKNEKVGAQIYTEGERSGQGICLQVGVGSG